MKGRHRGEPASIPALRLLGYAMAAVFAIIGGLFLVLPRGVVSFFNSLSVSPGMIPSPAAGLSFYSAMATAYMIVVTILAWNLGRRPWDRTSSRLLVQAKWASSLVSLILFFTRAPYLIFLVNGIVDALIGAMVFFSFRGIPADKAPAGKAGQVPAVPIRFEDAGSSKNGPFRK